MATFWLKSQQNEAVGMLVTYPVATSCGGCEPPTSGRANSAGVLPSQYRPHHQQVKNSPSASGDNHNVSVESLASLGSDTLDCHVSIRGLLLDERDGFLGGDNFATELCDPLQSNSGSTTSLGPAAMRVPVALLADEFPELVSTQVLRESVNDILGLLNWCGGDIESQSVRLRFGTVIVTGSVLVIRDDDETAPVLSVELGAP